MAARDTLPTTAFIVTCYKIFSSVTTLLHLHNLRLFLADTNNFNDENEECAFLLFRSS